MFISRAKSTNLKDVTRNDTCIYFTETQNNYMSTSSVNDDEVDTTYCFWVKAGLSASSQGYLFGHSGGFFSGACKWRPNLNRVQFYMDSGSDDRDVLFDIATNMTDDNLWHHWCFVIDVSTMSNCKVYVDGVSQSINAYDNVGATDNWGNLIIGANHVSSDATYSGFFGLIADVAVYEKLFTKEDVLTVYNSGNPFNHKEGPPGLVNDLVGWWRMGDGDENFSGTTIYDMSGNGKNGTFNTDETEPRWRGVVRDSAGDYT